MNFKAYYDIDKDEIKNCEPYSYEWFHESVHQDQFRTNGMKCAYDFWQSAQEQASPAFLLIAVFVYFVSPTHAPFAFIVAFFPHIAFCSWIIGLELDAIIRGTLRWLKYKRQQRD